jgi:arylsulfatase A-like enzyme
VHTRFADLLHAHTSVVAGSTARYPSASLGGETRVVVAGPQKAVFPLITRQHASVDVEIPRGGRLDVGFGVHAATPGALDSPIDFTVVVRSKGRIATVMNQTVVPGPDRVDRWHDQTIDLGDWEGPATLEFSTSSAASGLEPTTRTAAVETFFSAPVLTGPAGRSERRNLILISLDTLRADRLGIYGYDRPTSPNIDRIFGTNGLVVDRVYTNGADTLLGHTAMMLGLRPCLALTESAMPPLQSQVPWALSLAEVLRSAGYRTAAFTEDAFVGAVFGFDRGFERYAEERHVEPVPGIAGVDTTPGHIVETFERGKTWLDAHADAPFFLFLHTYQVHFPYTPPPSTRAAFSSPGDAPWARRDSDAYDAEIAYADAVVSDLLEWVDQRGLTGNTLVVVTADHGEEFGEHGFRSHGSTLHDEILHVPLLLMAPGLIPSGARRTGPMSLADLAPTLLDALHIEIPMLSRDRSRLRHLLEGDALQEPFFAEARALTAQTYEGRDPDWIRPSFAVTAWPLRLIRIRTPTGARFELYDLESDPGERNDLYATRGHEVSALVAKLDGYEEDCRQERERLAQQLAGGKETTGPARVMDPAQREKLRALGYLD